MSENTEVNGEKPQNAFSREIAVKAARKLRARRNSKQGVWLGLGMMGLIGWSVVIPTLLGAGIGIWLDKLHYGSHSWTLMMWVIGLGVGCWSAW